MSYQDSQGRSIPRTTEIIGGFAPHWRCDDWYLQRGAAVHAAIHLWLRGELDESSVDPQIAGRVAAVRKFLTDHDLDKNSVAVERKMVSHKVRFGGTVDFVGKLGEGLIGVDWKGSLTPHVIPQLGAYHLLWTENGNAKWRQAAAVETHDDGSYKVKWLTRNELEQAQNLFRAMLTIHNFLTKHKLRKEN